MYAYDGLARLSQVLYPGLSSLGNGLVGQFYTYQGQNLTQIGDQQPNSITLHQYTYDSSWRRTVDNVYAEEKTTYTYTGGGSLVQTMKIEPLAGTAGTTQTISYGYDSLGRVQGMQWGWTPNLPFVFDYHPNGQYSRITYPNGQSRVFSDDNQGRLTTLTNKDTAGNVLASFDYGYDYDWAAGASTMLGQRTSATVAAVAGTNLEIGLTKYQYDARYQLARVDRPVAGYDTWTYDAIGNRTSSRTATYAYYQNGQNPLNGQRLRSLSGSPNLVYDPAGNLTGYVTSPNTYVWDFAGRLTSAAGTSYTYDYQGRRRSVTAGNLTTRYISLGIHTVGERNTTTGVSTDYLFGPGIDEPLAKRTANGAISYYGVDALDSVVLVTDANGTVTDSSSYDPWGTRGGGSSELFGYTGRETGGPFWFYRARYYDPSTGRFLSEDPIHEFLPIVGGGVYD